MIKHLLGKPLPQAIAEVEKKLKIRRALRDDKNSIILLTDEELIELTYNSRTFETNGGLIKKFKEE